MEIVGQSVGSLPSIRCDARPRPFELSLFIFENDDARESWRDEQIKNRELSRRLILIGKDWAAVVKDRVSFQEVRDRLGGLYDGRSSNF